MGIAIYHRYPTYESVDTQQDEVDCDGDGSVAVHHGPCHWLVFVEQIRQQALLVRRIAKGEIRCNRKTASSTVTLKLNKSCCHHVQLELTFQDSRKLPKLSFQSNCKHLVVTFIFLFLFLPTF